MKWLAVLLLSVACLTGCNTDDVFGHAEAVERIDNRLPVSLRQPNYWQREDNGSCCHAVIITLLNSQGRYSEAAHWRRTYIGGEFAESLNAKLDQQGIAYQYTAGLNNTAFVELAVQAQGCCGLALFGYKHFLTCFRIDDEWVGLIDPNDVETDIYIPRTTFDAEFEASGSWAVVLTEITMKVSHTGQFSLPLRLTSGRFTSGFRDAASAVRQLLRRGRGKDVWYLANDARDSQDRLIRCVVRNDGRSPSYDIGAILSTTPGIPRFDPWCMDQLVVEPLHSREYQITSLAIRS